MTIPSNGSDPAGHTLKTFRDAALSSLHWCGRHPKLSIAAVALIVVALTAYLARQLWVRRRARHRTEIITTDARQDHPLTEDRHDLLDRGPFVESIVRALVRAETDATGRVTGASTTGFVVGLTGPWGSGKSSILNFLKAKLTATPHVAVCVINPWLFRDRDELMEAFFNALGDALRSSTDRKLRRVLKQVGRYRKSIAWAGSKAAALAQTSHPIAAVVTAAAVKLIPPLKDAPSHKPTSPIEERRRLERSIAEAKGAVVVLIDELDRVEDAEVRAVAQLVKAVGEIRGVSYLVAYDPRRVAEALGRGEKDERTESGLRYLEKIVQLPIPIRPLFEEDVDALLKGSLADFGVSLPEPPDETQAELFASIKAAITTAREVKRLVAAFVALEGSVRGEIAEYDLLAYCWILTKSDPTRASIADHVDDVVDDPSDSEAITRALSKTTPDPVAVLGPTAGPFERTLRLLFPVFGGKRGAAPVQNRISRRRNLVRLLYLGNPPGMVRRTEIERVWSLADAAAIEVELRSMLASGTLGAFMDRLDDLVAALPAGGDAAFWIALSRVLRRDADWAIEADARRSVAESATETLVHLGTRDQSQAPRARQIADALQAAGDLVIIPGALRKHLFAHGLTKHGSERGGDVIWDRETTQRLLQEELPRYRDAVLDGTALRRLPNVEALYVVANTGGWDEELHSALTEQLDGIPAVATMAFLLMPPGYSVEHAHLQELFETDTVRDRLDEESASAPRPSDPVVLRSLERFDDLLHDPSLDGV